MNLYKSFACRMRMYDRAQVLLLLTMKPSGPLLLTNTHENPLCLHVVSNTSPYLTRFWALHSRWGEEPLRGTCWRLQPDNPGCVGWTSLRVCERLDLQPQTGFLLRSQFWVLFSYLITGLHVVLCQYETILRGNDFQMYRGESVAHSNGL